jgi:hypothetical protein
MAKLAVIASGFIHETYTSETLEAPRYEHYVQSLEAWTSTLPQGLHNFQSSLYVAEDLPLPIEDEFASVRSSLSPNRSMPTDSD